MRPGAVTNYNQMLGGDGVIHDQFVRLYKVTIKLHIQKNIPPIVPQKMTDLLELETGVIEDR